MPFQYYISLVSTPVNNFLRLPLVISLTIFIHAAYAQPPKIDSLKNALSYLRDSGRIDCLNALSGVYSLTRPDTARLVAYTALKESEKLNYKKGIGEAYNDLAWIKWILADDYPGMEVLSEKAIVLLAGRPEKEQLANSWYLLGLSRWAQAKFSLAINAYEKASHLFLMIGDKLRSANMYAFMANVEESRGQYEKSLQYSVKWLDLSTKLNSIRYLDVWADLYKQSGDYETAMEYYRQAAENAKLNGVIDELTWFTIMIGEIFLLQKNYDSAGYYYRLASKISPRTPAVKPRLGELFLELNKPDTALVYLEKAFISVQKANHSNAIMWFLLRLSKAYKNTNNDEAALQSARRLLQLAKETGARQYIRDGHFLMYQLFTELNKERAYHHLQQYTFLKDSIDKDLSVQKLAFYKIKSEKEKDQSRIDLLNEEKKLQQQQLKQKAQESKFLTTVIAALLIIGLIFFRSLILKRRNDKIKLQHELELQQLDSEKTKIVWQQQATELEMRALRAQMNPHFIFNSLNCINRFILQSDKLQASQYLSSFSKLMRLILQNSQASLITLESELEALQLYLELEKLRLDDHFVFNIIIDDGLDTAIVKIPPLLIQPFAENAIWHGLMHKEGKGHLAVELFQHNEMLCCKITDNGIGRKKAEALNHKSAIIYKSMGLRITKERIAMLQQQKQIKSSVDIIDLVLPDGTAGGTEVLLKIPLIIN